MARPIMTTEYRDLTELEGEEVTIGHWAWSFEDYREQPASARILKNYQRTVLFELISGQEGEAVRSRARQDRERAAGGKIGDPENERDSRRARNRVGQPQTRK